MPSPLARQLGLNGARPAMTLDALTGGPQPIETIEDRAARVRAALAGPTEQGFMRGKRGLTSALGSYGGTAAEAFGASPETSQSMYDYATRQNDLAALEAPDLKSWENVRGPGDTFNYARGAVGEFLPVMAPALAAGGLGAAARLGTTGRMIAGMAPLHPVMAGGTAAELHEDPLTRDLPASERFKASNIAGLGKAAALVAPGMAMQGRAAGLAPFAARASINPLRTVGGIAADTALASGAMGAGMVGSGEVGRGVHRAYNPEWMNDPAALEEARKEEFASGALGILPHALPHAVAGRTIGPALAEGRTVADLAKKGGKAVLEGGKTAAEWTAEQAGMGVRKGGEFAADKLAPVYRETHDAYTAAYDAAREGGAAPVDAHFAATDAASKVVGTKVGETAETVREKSVGMFNKIGESAEAASLARRGRKAVTAMENFFGRTGNTEATPEIIAAATAENSAKLDAVVRDAANTGKVPVEEMQAYAAAEDVPAKAEAAQKIFDRIEPKKHVGDILEELGIEETPNKKTAEDTPLSRQGDVANYAVAAALREAKIGKDTVQDAVKTVQMPNLIRDGVTVTMKRIHDALVKNNVLKADDNWGRRTPLYAKIEEGLRAVLEEHSPGSDHERGTAHVEGPFTESVSGLLSALYEKHPHEGVDPRAISKGVVNYIDHLANDTAPRGVDPVMYRENAHTFAHEMIQRYGEDGKQMLNDIVANAEARWGKDSAQYKRVAMLRESGATVSTLAAKLAPMLHPSALRGEKAESVLRRMSRSLDTIEADAGRRAGEIKELRQTLREKQRLVKEAAEFTGTEAELRRMKEKLPTDAELFADKLRLNKLESEKELPIEAAFLSSFNRELAHNAKASEVIKLVQDFRKAKQDLSRAETVNRGEGKMKAPPENLDEPLEGAKAADNEGEPALNRTEENQSTQGEEPSRAPKFIGTESAFNNDLATKRKGPTVEAPLNRHPSADYPEGRGQFTAAMKQAVEVQAAYRVADATWVDVKKWATEAATEHGKTFQQLMTEAMDASLEADKARMKAAVKSGRSVEELRQHIEARKELAAKLKQRAEEKSGRTKQKALERLGEDFWGDALNKNYVYIRAEPTTAENLAVSGQNIAGIFGPHEGESSEYYAVKQARDEAKVLHGADGKPLTMLRTKELVLKSLVPVVVSVGKGKAATEVKTAVDIPKLVRSFVERHQPGDITGLGKTGEKTAAALSTKAPEDAFNVSTRQHLLTPEQIKTAVLNTLSTLAGTKDLANAKELFGASKEKPYGNLSKDLVVYRGPEGIYTLDMLDLGTRVRSVSAEGKPQVRSYGLHADKIPALVGKTTRTAAAVREADIAAQNGVLRGALTKDGVTYDLKVKALLDHMLELNKIDPIEARGETKNGITTELAAQLVREGMYMLEVEGFKFGNESASTTAAQVREAWNSATVFTRRYGGEKPSPVTFKKLMAEKEAMTPARRAALGKRYAAHEISETELRRILTEAADKKTGVPTVPRNLESASIHEKQKKLAHAVSEVERISAMNLRGESTLKGPDDITSARTEEAKIAEAEARATGTFEDSTRANKYAADEGLNSRIDQTVRALKEIGGDAALFDVSDQRAFDTFRKDFEKLIAAKYSAEEMNTDMARTGLYLSDVEKNTFPEARGGKSHEVQGGGKPLTRDERLGAVEAMNKIARDAHGEGGRGPGDQATPEQARANVEKLVANVKDSTTQVKEILRDKLRNSAFREQSLTPDDMGHETVGGTKPERTADIAPPPETRIGGEIKPPEPESPHRPYAEAAVMRVLGKMGYRGWRAEGMTERILRNANYLQIKREVVKLEQRLKAGEVTPVEAVKELGVEAESKAEAPAAIKPEKPAAPPTQEDVPFSRATPGKKANRSLDIESSLYDMVSSILPKQVVEKLIVSKDLTDTKGAAVSGAFKDAARQILVNAFASEKYGGVYGAANHEVWHGVEKVLNALGKDGKHVLDTIYRHVDTPAVREALEVYYADDPAILMQMREAKPSERAAFTFQAFRNGAKMEIAPQTRGWFSKFANWIKEKLGFTTDQAKAEQFFKYLEEGGLVSDFQNPQAVLRGLGETRADSYRAKVQGVTKPIIEGVGVALRHTSERVRTMENPHFNAYLNAVEGTTGKGGWQNAKAVATNMYANRLTTIMEGKTEAQRRALMNSKAVRDFKREAVNEAVKQLEAAGHTDSEITMLVDRAFENTFAVNRRFAEDHIDEFVTDLLNHSGLEFDKNALGSARDVAQRIVEEGSHFDPDFGRKLFADNESMQKKWGDPSVDAELSHAVRKIVDVATRAEFFGKFIGGEYRNEKIAQWMEKGKETATADQIATMEKVVDAFEGRLGADISPGTKKLISAIMVANNIRLLPLAIFTQFLDAPQLALRKNEYGAMTNALMKGIYDLPRSFDKFDAMYNKRWQQEFAEDLGVIANKHVGTMLTNVHAGYHMGGRAGRLNETFFKWTLQEQWNRSLHEIAAGDAVAFLKTHHKMETPLSQRFMKELGLEKGDVRFDSDGYKGLNYKDVKIQRAISQYVREAVALPDVGSNALWMNDPRFALFAQLKKFQFAHARYILDRSINEWKMDNKSLPLVLLPMSMGVSYAAEQVKWAVSGGMPTHMNNWTFTDWIAHEASRSAAGRWNFGDDFLNAMKYGASPVETLGGPTVEGASRIARAANVKGLGGKWDALFGTNAAQGILMPD